MRSIIYIIWHHPGSTKLVGLGDRSTSPERMLEQEKRRPNGHTIPDLCKLQVPLIAHETSSNKVLIH